MSPETVKSVSPSVLARSGSSTPASWLLVVEKSGAASALGAAGAVGPAVAVGAGGATIGSTVRPGWPCVVARWSCA